MPMLTLQSHPIVPCLVYQFNNPPLILNNKIMLYVDGPLVISITFHQKPSLDKTWDSYNLQQLMGSTWNQFEVSYLLISYSKSMNFGMAVIGAVLLCLLLQHLTICTWSQKMQSTQYVVQRALSIMSLQRTSFVVTCGVVL